MLVRSLKLATAVLLINCVRTDARPRGRICPAHPCEWQWGNCTKECGGGIQRAEVTVKKGKCGWCNIPTRPRLCNPECCPSNCHWESWGRWGLCSRSCGNGTRIRSRGQSAASCGGTGCTGSSNQLEYCNTHCCTVNCSWGVWSSWTSCSEICGVVGTRSRTRSFASASSCGGQTCVGPRSETESCTRCCPVHCSWANWGEWSTCSENCGGGEQSRSRNYLTEASCGGRNCPGTSSESRECNNQCCPRYCLWRAWSKWTDCPVSCGGGSQQRIRGYAINPACGGRPCLGDTHDNRTCNTDCCPVNCKLDSWSSWESCSTSCGGGNRIRQRLVKTPASCGGQGCLGSRIESGNCNDHCCPVDCVWNLWQRWGPCSESCGGGVQTRSRSFAVRSSCNGKDCNGKAIEQRTCNDICCPIHCSWARWSAWVSCSVSCGGGYQNRSRFHAVKAVCGGRPCTGISRETRNCNKNCCPVNCKWDIWGSWESCSASCGSGNQVRRRRSKISASCGGRICKGPSSETRQCNTQCCPTDCIWASWQEWGTCSVSCGGGIQNRSREPAQSSSCGGQICNGIAQEERKCNEACCPVQCVWESWSNWGSCSHTCGGGVQTRSRGEDEAERCGGNPCQGNSTQARPCNSECCLVSCVWNDWSPWSGCSTSCGDGLRKRNRSVAVPVACGGAGCAGSPSQVQVCNSGCCPIDCKWNDWSQWEVCSKSCGKGTQRRWRIKLVESQCNGEECVGSTFQERFCNDVCCPVHCKWADWNEWAGCTKTCGNGTQTRLRDVQVDHTCQGKKCVGDNTEWRSCSSQCCPVDCKMSSWTTWSECSHSCGANGKRIRNRNISQPSVCGGTPCSVPLSEDESCNRICFNGGSLVDNTCQCTDIGDGECCTEDLTSKIIQEDAPTVNIDTENKIINTMKKPYVLAIIALAGTLLIAILVLLIKISIRRSKTSQAILRINEGRYSERRSLTVSKDTTF